MARPKTEVSDDIMDAAMRHFWAYGYFASSVDELVKSSGLNRAAMYKHFGGKQGLFEALLHRYRYTVTEQLIGPLNTPHASLDDVLSCLRRIRKELRSLNALGCLLAMAASEVAPHAPGVHPMVDEYFESLRSGLKKALARAQRSGALAKHPSAAKLAAHLTASIIGASTLARSTTQDALGVASIDGAIQLLEALQP